MKTNLTTGTSIISLRYDTGVLVASDSRATDTSSFEHYHCEKSYTTVIPEIIVSGAGAACGVQLCVLPFISYLKKQITQCNITLDDIETPNQFINLYNSFVLEYNRTVRDPNYVEVLQASVFIINVCTSKFNFAFKSHQCGDDLIAPFSSYASNQELAKAKNYAGDLIAIGSGSRYLLGAMLQANNTKLLKNCSLAEVENLLMTAFTNTTIKDLASAVDSHLLLITLEDDKKITTKKLIING